MLSGTQLQEPARTSAGLTGSAEFLAGLLQTITQPFAVVAPGGRVLLWNRAYEELTGCSPAELTDNLQAESLGAESLAVAEPVLKTGHAQTCNTRWRTRDGREVPVEVSYLRLDSPGGSPLLLLLAEDLSERQRLEAELRQSQKIEALGKLAGGIAHDFNNVLTTILGLTEAMMNGRAAPTSESLREIHYAASHAAELTHSLLAFSRRQILQMRNLGLDAVVENVAKMVSRLIGEDIRLEIERPGPLPPIRADQSRIEQVLLNLCLNARDAMPQGGELRIQVRPETLTPSWCQQHKGSRPGRYVRLSVRDSGHGMDPETLQHIFEPFFTRKEVGKGTGLGLSLVYGIVKQHEGFIHVTSRIGAGTEFFLYFPAASGEPEPLRKAETTAIQGGSATVLVVEDEKSVRRLILEVLPKLGYRVFAAADGEEALKVFNRWADQIDLVLLDAVLPKVGSREIYETIRRHKPSVRFLFTSGYNEVFINQKFELDPSFLFLRKPFTTLELATMIHSALASDIEPASAPPPSAGKQEGPRYGRKAYGRKAYGGKAL